VAQAVTELERRTAEAHGELERRLGSVEAKKQLIDRSLIDANRIAEVLSGLDTRIAALAERHEFIDRTKDDVARLERRIDLVAARPELAAENDRFSFALRRIVSDASMAIQRLGSKGREPLRAFRSRGALTACIGAVILVGVMATRSAYRSGQNEPAVLGSRLLALPILAPMALPQSVARDVGAAKTVNLSQPPAVVAVDAALRDSLRNGEGGQQFVGDLTIESQPAGATVLLNQRAVGKTPVLLTSLRAGSYVLWIEQKGYNRWSAAVLVSAVHQTRINAKLEPDGRQ
jgi:hypothetical protein